MPDELDSHAELQALRQIQRNVDSLTAIVLWQAAHRFNDLVSRKDENQLIKVSTWLSEGNTEILLLFEYRGGSGLGSFRHEYYPREAVRSIVFQSLGVHDDILKENGLDPLNQDPSAYLLDVVAECVNTTVSLFQNYRQQLAITMRHSYDDAVEHTKAVMMHSIHDKILKLPSAQSASRKRSFLEESSKKAARESETRKRKFLVGLFNYLADPDVKPSKRLRKTRNSKQQESLMVRRQIIDGIRKLLRDNEKLKKAAIARASGLKPTPKRYEGKPKGYKGNMTQNLNDTLKYYGLSLEELIEEAKSKI